MLIFVGAALDATASYATGQLAGTGAGPHQGKCKNLTSIYAPSCSPLSNVITINVSSTYNEHIIVTIFLQQSGMIKKLTRGKMLGYVYFCFP